jgi:hypothetical protein
MPYDSLGSWYADVEYQYLFFASAFTKKILAMLCFAKIASD